MFKQRIHRDHEPFKHALRPRVKHAVRGSAHTHIVDIGDRIRMRRKELALSRAEVAKACGVSPQAVHQWENGTVEFLRPENLVAVAEKLKCYVRWLVLGTGPKGRLITRDQLSTAEDKLIEHYRMLSPELRQAVEALALSLAKGGNSRLETSKT